MTWPAPPSDATLPATNYDQSTDSPSAARAELLSMKARVDDLSARLKQLIDHGEPIMPAGGSMTGALNFAAGVTVASAATVNLGAANSNTVTITGTIAITSLGTASAGVERRVTFAGALTLTHNSTSLILPGAADVLTASNDVATFVSLGGGNWRCVQYLDASASPVSVASASSTVGTNSGTTVVLSSSIPSYATEVTVAFESVSSNGSDEYLLRLGSGGSPKTTGYKVSATRCGGTSVATNTSTVGFNIRTNTAAVSMSGVAIFVKGSSNKWVGSIVMGDLGSSTSYFTGGSVSLSGALDNIVLTTTGGTNAFDGGEATISWK